MVESRELKVLRSASWVQSNMMSDSIRRKFHEGVAEHRQSGDAYTAAVLRSLDGSEQPLALCSGFQIEWFYRNDGSATPEFHWSWIALTNQSLYVGGFATQPIKLGMFERGKCLIEPHPAPYIPLPEVTNVKRFSAAHDVRLNHQIVEIPSDGFEMDGIFHESLLLGAAYGRDSSLYGTPILIVEVAGDFGGEHAEFDFFDEDGSAEEVLKLLELHGSIQG